jgi:hypothetical protein
MIHPESGGPPVESKLPRPRPAVLAAAAAFFLCASSAPAAVIRVPTQVASFRVAVQGAAPGDTVQLVGNGGATYLNSNVTIDKDLLIQGGWRADFQVRDPATYVSVVRDVTEVPTLPLIRVAGAVRVTFDGVWLWGGTVGVLANGGADLVFRDCTLRGQRNNLDGDVDANRGGALRLVGGSALLENCRIQSVNISYGGAGIAAISASSLVLRNSVIANCLSTRFLGGDASGAAVYARSVGELRIEGSTLSDCGTVQNAGLVFAQSTTVTAIGSRFLRGLASTNGGAFALEGASATFEDCDFEENRGIEGGALRVGPGSSVVVRNSRFRFNRAAGRGGALWSDSAALLLEDCTFERNHVAAIPSNVIPERGGAVYALSTEATVTGCTFTDERATGKGGAWFQIGGHASIAHTRFVDCDSGIFGGAAAIELGGLLEFRNVLMKRCSARFGGAVAASFTGAVRIERSTLVEGTGRSSGAGVYVDTGGTVDLEDTILCCALQGDLVFCQAGAVRADHCDVWNDDASNIRVEWAGACPDPTGSDGNLKVSPGFCPGDPDFRVPAGSVCATGASDGGAMGWLAAGCPSSVPLQVAPMSWGRIKAAWRDR